MSAFVNTLIVMAILLGTPVAMKYFDWNSLPFPEQITRAAISGVLTGLALGAVLVMNMWFTRS